MQGEAIAFVLGGNKRMLRARNLASLLYGTKAGGAAGEGRAQVCATGIGLWPYIRVHRCVCAPPPPRTPPMPTCLPVWAALSCPGHVSHICQDEAGLRRHSPNRAVPAARAVSDTGQPISRRSPMEGSLTAGNLATLWSAASLGLKQYGVGWVGWGLRVGLAEKKVVLRVLKVYWRPQLILKISQLFET